MTKQEQDILFQDGKMLPVMEHFYTLQGEGAHAGRAAYFIRLAGCDVGCHWCDVKESWDANRHEVMDMQDLARLAASHCKTIIITGGEPLMWNLVPLTTHLKELGRAVHLETSGAYPLSGNIDWITLSPKKRGLPVGDIYEKASELKVVIFNQNDFLFAQQQASKVGKDCLLYLQSEWSKRDLMYPKITDFVMKNQNWRASVQTHKYMDIP